MNTIVSVMLNVIMPGSGLVYSAVVGNLQSASLAERVSKTEQALKAFDANGDGVLSTAELEAALRKCTGQRKPDEIMMRALLTYLVGVWRAWDRDPEGTKSRLEKRLSFWTWMACGTGEVGKQDYALAVFYGSDKCDKIMKSLKDAGQEVSSNVIEQEVLPAVQEILGEALGEAAASTLISTLACFL